jgi:hypothetical protein
VRRPLRADDVNRRTVHTLASVTRLNLTIRRCHTPGVRPTSGLTDRPIYYADQHAKKELKK